MTPWHDIEGADTGVLLIGDHASSHVPDGVDLGVPAALMREHVAVDIGVAPLAEALCRALDCPAILGGVSRLVIDLNREADAPGLVPATSDGHVIPGNAIDRDVRQRRIDAYWRPYHRRIAERIAATSPILLISLHSFTPELRTEATPRPWEIGILYNQDERAARIALPLLAAAGIVAGDNLPYSGKLLNATMNAHGEANGIAYLGIEVRQDLISDDAGIARWAARLAPIIRQVRAGL
ncbi:N-formylglutamate amidohydrolase [Sphingomonas nostoxanthinifaciens]|uniref:N-formylglutamate amidohydrolase n=1 Tax=Sphingomonas nostoxanthinifaciens TaxID=2872652 RepID=UPI001CC21092|nr:N-formylglutamate amidohydrolase [Sphingomonas nostoxanthinifaciens]